MRRGNLAARGAPIVALAFALLVLTTGTGSASIGGPAAPVDPTLTAVAAQSPFATLKVVIQGKTTAASVAQLVQALPGGVIRRQLPIIRGVAADIRADALQLLAASSLVRAVTPDALVVGSSYAPLNPNVWQATVAVDDLWA